MNKLSMIFMLFFILGWPNVSQAENFLPDEPETGPDKFTPRQVIGSYAQALGVWKTAEDINKWVAGNFAYDKMRAIKLSSNQRTKNKEISIYEPSKFFKTKTGVCVDFARFGFETLKILDPNSDPKYLMIEFEPIQINGNTFRLHWLVSFEKGGRKYFFCDSKRPGHIAGPFNSAQAFINEYAQYRGRKIVSHKELESYKKKIKLQSAKKGNTKSPNMVNAVDR